MFSHSCCHRISGVRRDVHVPVILEGKRPSTKRLVMVHKILQIMNRVADIETGERVGLRHKKSMIPFPPPGSITKDNRVFLE